MAVYLDHAATTPMRAEAIAAYTDALGSVGNPASIHSHGQRARNLLEDARERIARTLGCDPIEVVFTSGGTEAINLAVKGIHWARQRDRVRPLLLVPDGEHHATLDTADWVAEHEGAEIGRIPLDARAGIRLDALREVLDARAPEVSMLTAIWVNNEVGTIQPVQELAALAAVHGIPLHLDAVAAYGHLPVALDAVRASSGSRGESGLVALSVSAHKIGGPVGVGALVLARSAQIVPILHGGGQQRDVRSGTQDVAAAAAFAVAAELAERERVAETERLTALRDRLIAGVLAALPAARLNGAVGDARVATNASFWFPGAQGDSLLMLLDVLGVSVSTGSACQAGIPEPSHVLLAMGRSEEDARSVLRLTLGRPSTQADVDAVVSALPEAYERAARAGLASRESRFASS